LFEKAHMPSPLHHLHDDGNVAAAAKHANLSSFVHSQFGLSALAQTCSPPHQWHVPCAARAHDSSESVEQSQPSEFDASVQSCVCGHHMHVVAAPHCASVSRFEQAQCASAGMHTAGPAHHAHAGDAKPHDCWS
jgi:hypothetical protein